MPKKNQPNYKEYETELERQIRSKEFRPVYLVCGEQDYLRTKNVKRLREALLGDGDAMNSTVLKGAEVRAFQVIEMAQTLPFFAERRVITLEDTDFLKKAGDEAEKLCEFLPKMPETTHLIFEETAPNKTYRLYKAIAKAGYVMVCDTPGEGDLRIWTAGLFSERGLRISNRTLDLFLQYSGTDMLSVQSEAEKLSAYCYGKEEVLPEDIRAVCTPVIRDRIFDMIQSIAAGEKDEALSIYLDLVKLQTAPQVVLALMLRQYNQLLQLKELLGSAGESEAAAQLKINPWILSKKLRPLVDRLKRGGLESCLEECMKADFDYKTGKITPELAVERLIVLCCIVKRQEEGQRG